MPEKLSYGQPDTQYGVVTHQLEDGGVEIIVPHPSTPLGWLHQVASKLFRDFPHRAVITLNRQQLNLKEADPEQTNRITERSWPTSQVGALRANRYSRGLYVSITGTDNFDALIDLPDPIVKYVGATLEGTLERLRVSA